MREVKPTKTHRTIEQTSNPHVLTPLIWTTNLMRLPLPLVPPSVTPKSVKKRLAKLVISHVKIISNLVPSFLPPSSSADIVASCSEPFLGENGLLNSATHLSHFAIVAFMEELKSCSCINSNVFAARFAEWVHLPDCKTNFAAKSA